MRALSIVLAGLATIASVSATTLQQLSLEDMIRQSTGIVLAKVTGSRSVLRGQNIYTYYRLDILETAKQAASRSGPVEVAVPGGTVDGVHQMAIGAPELKQGSEYVLFLWTGKSGMTQIMGLSQGLFVAAKDASGRIQLSRPAAGDLVLDRTGHPVDSPALSLSWAGLLAQIRRTQVQPDPDPRQEARK